MSRWTRGRFVGQAIVASVLAGALAVPTTLAPVVHAAPAEDPEALIEQAEAALDENRHGDAARLFEQAYRAMPPRQRAGDLGDQVVNYASRAYSDSWLDSDDLADLEASQKLLRDYLADLESVHGAEAAAERAPRARRELARVTKTIERLEPKPPPDDTDGDEGAEDESGDGEGGDEGPILPPPPPKTDDRRMDRLGLGLSIGGGVLILGGVGMIIGGSQILPNAEQKLEDRGGASDGDQEYLDDNERTGNGVMAGGGVVAALGLGALIYGVIRIVKAKKQGRETALHVTGAVGSRTLGVVLFGRF